MKNEMIIIQLMVMNEAAAASHAAYRKVESGDLLKMVME